ncbi:MAG: hypothetical protein QJT81_16425 [Candidatus Thiothrix putei]|jgi:preprotein translocase subunit SecG|uniref:Uncharacterized protein n=1 Tax=Candidatus Thiothrix putei TaxID=3080811 RepID=A0AA95HAJ0_9GAMM|nr:MAG: hypothetical protein QJT81_16425 [Candidatus Thiothrix putei]
MKGFFVIGLVLSFLTGGLALIPFLIILIFVGYESENDVSANYSKEAAKKRAFANQDDEPENLDRMMALLDGYDNED